MDNWSTSLLFEALLQRLHPNVSTDWRSSYYQQQGRPTPHDHARASRPDQSTCSKSAWVARHSDRRGLASRTCEGHPGIRSTGPIHSDEGRVTRLVFFAKACGRGRGTSSDAPPPPSQVAGPLSRNRLRSFAVLKTEPTSTRGWGRRTAVRVHSAVYGCVCMYICMYHVCRCGGSWCGGVARLASSPQKKNAHRRRWRISCRVGQCMSSDWLKSAALIRIRKTDCTLVF